MSLYQKIDRGLVGVIKGVSYVSAVCLVLIMLIAFFNVIGEKLAKLGIPWVGGIPIAMALIQYLHIPVVFLASAYVTLDRGHIRIDMLSSRFPRAVEKGIVALGNALGAAIAFFISYRAFFVLMVRFFQAKSPISTSTNFLVIPKWPFAFIHGLGFFLLGISFLWSIVRHYAEGTKNREDPLKNHMPQECEGI